MREIEFRGKRKSEISEIDGTWMYGSLYHAKFLKTGNVLYRITPYEDCEESYHVYPETVGQYTGLKDSNGVKIFEGDIVKYFSTLHLVQYQLGGFYIGADTLFSLVDNVEVIGNIHDNPELLEAVK